MTVVPDPALLDADGLYVGAPASHPWPNPFPVVDFPAWKRQEIGDAVLQETPPPSTIGNDLVVMTSRAWVEWHWARGLPAVERRRSKISPEVRRLVYERDGHRCVTCGTDEGLTLDHIYPWSLGGEDTVENLQAMCRSCNSSKGARV